MRHRRLVVIALSLLLASLTAPAQAGLLELLGTAPAAAPSATGWNVFGRSCSLIAVPTASPLAGGTCPGVRPGAVLRMAGGGQCTFNFMFRGGDRATYMGTAGHCVLGEGNVGGGDVGERTWAAGTGPVALDGTGRPVGRFAYAVLQEPKDFALIRLDPGVVASPQVCHFGGPTGINTDPTVGSVEFFGQGVLVSSLLPARSGIGIQSDADKVYALGVALPGDSGSGVVGADGRAIGALVGISVGVGVPPNTGVVITRLGPQLTRASQALNTALTLQTAPAL